MLYDVYIITPNKGLREKVNTFIADSQIEAKKFAASVYLKLIDPCKSQIQVVRR